MTGPDGTPSNVLQNTAGIVASKMAVEYDIKQGIEITIKKGVPVGFGMGSKIASAAAAAVAFDRSFKLELSPDTLVRHAPGRDGKCRYDTLRQCSSIRTRWICNRSG